MATFVLVHGAMHGGWCWRGVRRGLVAAGHEVFAPTLTGQGDRRQGLSPKVGVATHVTDITDLLWFEDLTDVHLVLHSYAGILAGPIADIAEGRLASVIYLAAFVTGPGQSLLDVEPPETARRYRELAERAGDGWFLPAEARFLDQWGITDASLRARVGRRLTAFPLRCQTEPTDFTPAALERIRKVYIGHTDPPLPSLTRFMDAARAAGWETHQMTCGHDMMLAHPEATAALLAAVAEGAEVPPLA
jgi:pimeloyl-ACP methyl ester carboxylesterase